MAKEIKKQENTDAEVSLTKASAGLKKLIFGASWDFVPSDGEALDVDLSCFVLNRDNLTRDDEDFVFYNNLQGAALAVKHLGDNRAVAQPINEGDTDDEAIMIDLDNLSFDVWRIVFVASIYNGDERDQSFTKLRKVTIRIENADSNVEIHSNSCPGAKIGAATAVKIAELYRNGVEWFYVPTCQPIKGGLSEVAREYGLLISSTT